MPIDVNNLVFDELLKLVKQEVKTYQSRARANRGYNNPIYKEKIDTKIKGKTLNQLRNQYTQLVTKNKSPISKLTDWKKNLGSFFKVSPRKITKDIAQQNTEIWRLYEEVKKRDYGYVASLGSSSVINSIKEQVIEKDNTNIDETLENLNKLYENQFESNSDVDDDGEGWW